ncbi:hypothetical protein [Macrococcoides caseolyticum]|nr:hypothetical protein [Macrococcus caseolyticus]
MIRLERAKHSVVDKLLKIQMVVYGEAELSDKLTLYKFKKEE